MSERDTTTTTTERVETDAERDEREQREIDALDKARSRANWDAWAGRERSYDE